MGVRLLCLTLLAAAATPSPLRAQAATDVAAIRAIIADQVAAWDAGDGARFARRVAPEASFTSFTPYDRFAQFRENQGKPLAELLDEFERLRAANVATLREWHLTDAQLALEGEHPEFGPVTLRQLLATWVAHDLGHVAQTTRVMAKQYREAVGPWRAYLPVMDR